MKKNWKGEKFQKLLESEQKSIEARVEACKLEREIFRKARETKEALLKGGRKYIVDNQVATYSWEIVDTDGRYVVTAGVEIRVEGRFNAGIQIAYAICSKRDQYSARVARGYIGARLMQSQNNLVARWIPTGTLDYPAVLVAMLKSIFVLEALTNTTGCYDVRIPRGLVRAMRRELIERG